MILPPRCSYTDAENIQRKELMWEVIEAETEEQRKKRLVSTPALQNLSTSPA